MRTTMCARTRCMAHNLWSLFARFRSNHVSAHRLAAPFFRGKIVNLTVWRAEKTTNSRMHFTLSTAADAVAAGCILSSSGNFPPLPKRDTVSHCVNAHKMLALCRYTDPIERCQFETLFICSALWVWAPVHHRNHRLHCTRYNKLHVRWKRVRELPTQMTRSHTLARLAHISIHFHCVRHTLARSSSHTATECSLLNRSYCDAFGLCEETLDCPPFDTPMQLAAYSTGRTAKSHLAYVCAPCAGDLAREALG